MACVLYHTCDHCGEKLDDMTDFFDIELDVGLYYPDCDLCKKCAGELASIVAKFIKKKYPKEGSDQ